MAFRMLEATVPAEALEAIPELLKDRRIVQLWTHRTDEGRGLVRILLDAEDTEEVSDALTSRYGTGEGFRVVSLSVEATTPSVERRRAPATDTAGAVPPLDSLPRISREELYEDIAQASRLTRVYLVMVALSTVVAAVGLMRGDLAIVIGAMVIAPLLGPNVALSLACTLGDLDLAKSSLQAIAAGVATAAASSLLMGLIFTVDPSAPELAARTGVGLGDIVLGLAAGTAGSLAFTSGVPAVVVGVMVAVALLPPVVVAGLLAGSGHGAPAVGACILALTNVTCVNLAAVATFLVRKVRPRTWWEADRAKRATRIAVSTWIAMLAVLLVLIILGYVDTG